MEKWEYRCQFGHKGEIQSAAESPNQLGEQGWELVAPVPQNDVGEEYDMGNSIKVIFLAETPTVTVI
jgi:hypothetical protein